MECDIKRVRRNVSREENYKLIVTETAAYVDTADADDTLHYNTPRGTYFSAFVVYT